MKDKRKNKLESIAPWEEIVGTLSSVEDGVLVIKSTSEFRVKVSEEKAKGLFELVGERIAVLQTGSEIRVRAVNNGGHGGDSGV